jgi:ferredoxin
VDKPIICDLVRRFDLRFSILKAQVTPKEEGLMVLEIMGEDGSTDRGVEFLIQSGVKVQPLSQDIVRNEARCIHCGACVPTCPSGALTIDRKTMRVEFDNEKCIACEHCIKACPPRAMEVHF